MGSSSVLFLFASGGTRRFGDMVDVIDDVDTVSDDIATPFFSFASARLFFFFGIVSPPLSPSVEVPSTLRFTIVELGFASTYMVVWGVWGSP
jgi:hypothetical protein